MAIERADSIFDTDALAKEFAFVSSGIKETQASIVTLYKTMKEAKGSDLSGYAGAAEKMETAFVGAEKQSRKTQKAFDDTVKVAKTILQSNTDLSQSYEQMSGTLDSNLKLQLQYKLTLSELKKEQKDLSGAYAGTDKSASQLTARQVDLAKSIKEIEGANSELTRTLRLQIKEQNSAVGSVDEMKAQYDRLFQVFRGLTEEDRNSEFGVTLGKDLENLSNRINDIQKSVGNFSSNVGRYSESLAKPFELLQGKLQEIRDNLSQGIGLGGGTDSTSIKRAEEAAQALEKGLSDANKEGATLTQQVNAINSAFSTFVTTASKGDSTNTGFINEVGNEIAKVKVEIEDAKSLTDSFATNFKKYSGSFGDAFSVLERELDKIRLQLKTTGKDTPGFDELVRKEKILTQASQGLTRSFKNPQQELKAFQNATKLLGQEFGITSDEFQAFVTEVGSKKDQIDDIQSTINFQASDTKYLDGVVGAVNGLAGAYGVAESASVLFGDNSEELQKSMQKLQATLTLVTSLQALTNSLQSEGAAAQTLAVAKQALFNTAKEIDIAISKKKIVATNQDTISQVENIAAKESSVLVTQANVLAQKANIAALKSNIATTTLSTGAQEGYTIATEGAKVATLSLRATLIASGIGALILGVVAGVAYLVSQMKSWDAEIKENSKNLKEWADDIVSQNEVIQQQIDLIQKSKVAAKDKLVADLANGEALGQSDVTSLAMKIKIAEKEKEIAQDRIRQSGGLEAVVKGINEQEAAYQGLLATQKKEGDKLLYLDKLRKEGQKTVTVDKAEVIQLGGSPVVIKRKVEEDISSVIEGQRKVVEINGEAVSSTKKAKEELEAIDKAYTISSEAYANLRLAAIKLSNDEQRKLTLESARLEADLISDENNRILSNEKSTQAERLKALEVLTKQRKRVIRAELSDVINDPTKNGTDKSIARKKANEEELKAERDLTDKKFEVNETYRKRLLAAQLEYAKINLEYDKGIQEKLIANDENRFQDKLKSVQKYNADADSLLDKEYKHTIDTSILSNEERLSLDADYGAKKLALVADTQEKLLAVLKSELAKEKQIRDQGGSDIQSAFNSLNSITIRQYADDVIALNNSLQAKKIKYSQYVKEKENLDFEYGQRELKNQLDNLKQSLKLYDDNTDDIIADKKAIEETNDRIQFAENEAVKNSLLNYLAYLKSKLAADKAYADKRGDILDQIAKKEQDINTNTTTQSKKSHDDILNDLSEKISQIGDIINNSISAITNLASIGLDNQQRQVDNLEKTQQYHFDAEQERIARSSMSEEEKAQKQMELEAARQAQKEQNEREQRRIDIARARYEKASNIANIISSTALAVVNALKQQPYGIALAAVVGALGAAQLARAIATPIPAYKMGRGFGKEETAIVGDGGRSEYIVREGGTIEKTPAIATLTHLMPRDRVLKDKNSLMRELALSTLPVNNFSYANNGGQSLSKSDMARFADNIVGAVENISINTTIITKEGWRRQNGMIQRTNDWVTKKIKGN